MRGHQLILGLFFYLFASISFAQAFENVYDPEVFGKYRFAHRGGYANGPENTIETILLNIRYMGVKAIEVDIRETLDGHLVLFHDEKIERILDTNDDRLLSSMTLAELKAIPLRDKRLGEVYITEFKVLLDTLRMLAEKDGLDFLVELDFKPNGDATERAVISLYQCLFEQPLIAGKPVEEYFFASTFYPEVLKSLRNHSDKMAIGYAVNRNPDKQKLLARLSILASPFLFKKFKCQIIEPNHCMVTPRYIRRWTRRGAVMNAYTANSACEKSHLESLKIAYTTNCPNTTCEDDASDQTGKKKGWCKGCR